MTTDTQQRKRKPGNVALTVGVIAVPLALLTWVVAYALNRSDIALDWTARLAALAVLVLIAGIVALVVGTVRRLLAR